MGKTLVPTQAELAEAIRKVHSDGGGVCLPTAVDLMEPVDAFHYARLFEYAGDILAALRTTPNLATAVEDEREVCGACGGNGYSGGKVPDQEDLRGEYDFACEVCCGTGKATRPPTLPDDRDAVIATYRRALERIADPRNIHFAGDAQVVARTALSKHDRNEGGDDGQG